MVASRFREQIRLCSERQGDGLRVSGGGVMTVAIYLGRGDWAWGERATGPLRWAARPSLFVRRAGITWFGSVAGCRRERPSWPFHPELSVPVRRSRLIRLSSVTFAPPATFTSVMNATDLLAEFRENRSEKAFGELVRRYTNLVYSVAKRRLTSGTLAEEVTQSVFLRLA